MISDQSQSREWMGAWLHCGDHAAARALMSRYQGFVISLVRRHVADRGAEEDLVQQTFVNCFAKASQWNPDKPLEPWLARIALNLCRDHYRARRVRPELRWSDLTDGEQAAMEATLSTEAAANPIVDNDSRTLMLRLLDTLAADDRMVLSLLHLEGRSTDEIAALTGWSRTLVKVRAFRARGKLRTAFERLEAR